jgi:hypothetical protein
VYLFDGRGEEEAIIMVACWDRHDTSVSDDESASKDKDIITALRQSGPLLPNHRSLQASTI